MPEKLTEPQKRALAILNFEAPDMFQAAYRVAMAVGWGARSAGARLAALERRGLVERRLLARGGGKYCVPIYGWRTTDRGREVLRDE